jgi:hypothetical protein
MILTDAFERHNKESLKCRAKNFTNLIFDGNIDQMGWVELITLHSDEVGDELKSFHTLILHTEPKEFL